MKEIRAIQVNTTSKVGRCSGTRSYRRMNNGKYPSEDARQVQLNRRGRGQEWNLLSIAGGSPGCRSHSSVPGENFPADLSVTAASSYNGTSTKDRSSTGKRTTELYIGNVAGAGSRWGSGGWSG